VLEGYLRILVDTALILDLTFYKISLDNLYLCANAPHVKEDKLTIMKNTFVRSKLTPIG
jgi:hypothetical protein